MERCLGCGFDFGDVASNEVAPALLGLVPRWRDALSAPPTRANLLRRPDPTTWSVLEYACHVRDVLLTQRDRVILAMIVDTPTFVPMHRDERVEVARYRDETLDDVLADLAVAARLLAHVAARMTPEQLARTCTYGYPSPAERDLLWVLRHTIHEGEHHLHDVQAVLARLPD